LKEGTALQPPILVTLDGSARAETGLPPASLLADPWGGNMPALEIAVILLLILANSFFAAAEMAVVSARKARLAQWAQEGRAGAQTALDLADNPNRFLSTVQVGITLIGTLASVFGGASIAATLDAWFRTIPALAPYADGLALGAVVLFIAYFSLILGELVPKRLALQGAETMATTLAPIMALLARLTAPVVGFLTLSTEVVLFLLGRRHAEETPVNEEDIIALVREGVAEGTVEASEQDLISNIFSFTDRRVTSLMTPRTRMTAVAVTTPLATVRERFIQTGHACLPVYENAPDQIVGVLFAQDLLPLWGQTDGVDLRALLRPPLFVLETQRGIDVLQRFRQEQASLAIVVDEYGVVVGLVTQGDLLEEVVGEFSDTGASVPPLLRREDGSYLVDGLLPVADLQDQFALPGVAELARVYHFQTVAGLALAVLDHIPAVGEKMTWQGYTFEVVDMDGQRIDKLLLVLPGGEQTESALATSAMRPPFDHEQQL
jgi:putative hemolysin